MNEGESLTKAASTWRSTGFRTYGEDRDPADALLATCTALRGELGASEVACELYFGADNTASGR